MSTRKHSSNHRSTLSLQKTQVSINVYDLLPPGKLSGFLWAIGSGLLHSGVVVNGKEYAYGGHDRRGLTGVYWTKPRAVPPGGTFKTEILQGFTLRPAAEIELIIKEASEAFQGMAYNLLSKNCNHFTQYLCEKLTGTPGPAWLNRAASIGLALPCVVPKEWIAPPDFDTADGELFHDEEDEHISSDERSRMLNDRDSAQRHSVDEGVRDDLLVGWDSDEERQQGGSGKGKAPVRDTSGRVVPPADIAPTKAR
jgi:hypothetical protein